MKAAGYGAASGMLFGLSAALTKPTLDYLHESVGTMLSHWEPYALAIAGILGFLLQQVSLGTGRLAPSVATVSVANPIVSVISARCCSTSASSGPPGTWSSRSSGSASRWPAPSSSPSRTSEEGRGDRCRGRGSPRSRSLHRPCALYCGSATASSGADSELTRSVPSVGTSWIVCRIRPAILYGSPCEFGRRSSR